MVEGWLELGNFREAELAFQQLPTRALSTRRGLSLWLRLSLGLQRWPEVEAAACQLRAVLPSDTSLILHEAEALHHQGRNLQATALLANCADRFTGPAWMDFLATLKNYAAQASLPATDTDLLQIIWAAQQPVELRSAYAFTFAELAPHVVAR